MYVYYYCIYYLYDSGTSDRNLYRDIMTNKEAFDIVLKLANANTLAEYDIMYAEQQQQYNREQEALSQMEDYYNDVMED